LAILTARRSEQLQKTLLRTIPFLILVAIFGVGGSAYALEVELDGTVLSATAEITPRVLPAQGEGPVTISSVTRLKSTDGSAPEAMKQIVFLFDKHGSIDTKGLPTCSAAKLANTTPAEARKRCAGAIVGEGEGKATVTMPGASPVRISSPLTFFNTAPVGGDPALIAHAYETVPTPQTILVPLKVERVKHGRYGYQVKILLPEIAGGFGSATLAKATIGKTWKRGGKTVAYTSASCNGGRLQVHGVITLADGSFFPGTLTSPCHVGS
jgi:hypothetical protein